MTYVPWPLGFYINPRKITGFLLNKAGQKPDRAKFFLDLGFDPQHPGVLEHALFMHTSLGNYQGYIEVVDSSRIYFRGSLLTPKGPAQNVQSIWQLQYTDPTRVATFITAI
ncbi:hypothetical protein ABID82_006363 [Methylobacterium sp. PvP062]|uniref:DUF6883 domain-containing protein n=1 Tax=Methylobacterium radiotolerans TaxID=31998 RepID=A0ABV2NRR1_9HYPH|nr:MULTISPECIES: hypothetical protein [unclassified Methylobacterium]MBP2494075.1 hypothetical protein [Methylobacterium sp. PvP105]MBP2499551.1 hypothetical protein [Methylobacterium sp. PvP109]MCX7331678.1 hypothetical protein [Hyphomicrobiales bacterium]